MASYDAFDGAPFTETATEGRCKFLDLSVPIYHLNMYDWVISFEVGEHIPKAYEAMYLDNICRYAREGIILSWAVPGQGGHSHVNGQPFEYIVKQMEMRGFEIIPDFSKEIKENSVASWLRSNLNVFKRAQSIDINKIIKKLL